ncbi:rod-binding protein [Cereibacter azotoformans]|uniref:Rod binding protein n=1 Tax=Cereibacter azotoformans TaxID=43057 RepID=A0A2T5JU28_9RHOB|nr:rod-binding protein [Cereibacter azotoformans]AXQ95002.1 chemotaxis protein chel [Cereibacter sphaeroides]MBO4170111.1 rod-binding protein [Cereibacter azotoformans]PTR13666.1 rod binding protein [Cereibacter azotoformans]UIJ30592.1 rod-binding protein [Cereibacter azotoformans]
MSIAIPPAIGEAPHPRQILRQKAEELESAFLSEMLGHTGLGALSASFGGGCGEEQFGSFLRREQATAMVRAGGIGLAEHFHRSLTRGMDDAL